MRKNRRIYLGILILIIVCIFAMIKKQETPKDTDSIEPVIESEIEVLKHIVEEKTKDRKQNDNIRVLIMGNNYKGEVHPEVRISSAGKICMKYGKKKEYVNPDEEIVLSPDDSRFQKGNIRISSEKKIKLVHLERGYGVPSYAGKIELFATADGIAVINELSVENYLKGVVPSEMPASYELEALKAQAVCARSYAYRQMESFAYPEYKAHVNDSTEFQVYGNSKTQKSTNQAVKETKGQAVYYKDKIATTYYFSTSCGYTTDVRAWGTKKTEKNKYLKAVKVKGRAGYYEEGLPWYRWRAEIPVETLSNLVGLNISKDIGLLRNIKVTKRGGGDVALQVELIGENGNATVNTENEIRKAFGGSGYQIELMDGTVTDSRDLLPSAFFEIEKTDNTFVIKGGGFGHGLGMSQNGANEMAKKGKNYKDILKLFYQDIEIR